MKANESQKNKITMKIDGRPSGGNPPTYPSSLYQDRTRIFKKEIRGLMTNVAVPLL